MVMTSYSHNEDMYISAGVLSAEGMVLYKDFAYLQMPYLPLLYSFLYKLFGITSFYFLVAKFVSYFFLIASGAILFLVSKRLFKDTFFSLLILTLFLLNQTIVNPAAEVSNYVGPLFFSFLSFFFFYLVFAEEKKNFFLLFSGLSLSIAVGLKLTYASLVPAFLLAVGGLIFFQKKALPIKLKFFVSFKNLTFFISGIVLGGLPLLIYVQDYELFYFNNLGYHRINTVWRELTQYEGPMMLYEKILYGRTIMLDSLNILLIFTGFFIGFYKWVNLKKRVENSWQALKKIPFGILFLIVLILISAVGAILPTPSFHQYFAVPVSFYFFLIIFLWKYTLSDEKIKSLLRSGLLVVVLITTFYKMPTILRLSYNLLGQDKWVGIHSYKISQEIKNILKNNELNLDGKIATLEPYLVHGANLKIYPELATGTFLYRVGDLISGNKREQVKGTSQKSIANLFKKDPPIAVLLDPSSYLSEALLKFVRLNGYEKVKILSLPDREFYIAETK